MACARMACAAPSGRRLSARMASTESSAPGARRPGLFPRPWGDAAPRDGEGFRVRIQHGPQAENVAAKANGVETAAQGGVSANITDCRQNVLLSFAQFEREVIGERVRNKIAASKRKGIWVGEPVPLGYRSVDKKLQIAPDEADVVRKIFKNYLALGSLSALAASLNAEALKPNITVLN